MCTIYWKGPFGNWPPRQSWCAGKSSLAHGTGRQTQQLGRLQPVMPSLLCLVPRLLAPAGRPSA
eukprot:8933489-Prorocentrum_lima.AAC.1